MYRIQHSGRYPPLLRVSPRGLRALPQLGKCNSDPETWCTDWTVIRITRDSHKNSDTRLLRAPSRLSINRTKAAVRNALGEALVRRRKPHCASYTNTAVPVLEFSRPVAVPLQYGTVRCAKYCLSRTELSCQRPVTQALNVIP